jgi:hypothetical protein
VAYYQHQRRGDEEDIICVGQIADNAVPIRFSQSQPKQKDTQAQEKGVLQNTE